MDLLILSADVASEEIQAIFGEIPSVLVPFNDRIAIDYIYMDNYLHYDTIHIVCYKESGLIKEYINKKKYKVNVIVIPEFKDLSYTITYAINSIKSESVSVIFGDTYIPFFSKEKGRDVLYYSKTNDTKKWTIINRDNEGVINFFDKKEFGINYSFDIVVGGFHFRDKEYLLECLKENQFYIALEKYYNSNSYDYIKSYDWVDFGHVENYFSQKKIDARFFNNLNKNLEKNTITKTSDKKEKLIDEISWYLKIPNELKEVIPEIINYSIEENSPFIEMKYYNYLSLQEIYINGNHKIDFWILIFTKLKEIEFKFSQNISSNNTEIKKRNAVDIYITKTIDRIEEFETQTSINFDKPIVINGKSHKSINTYKKNLLEIASRINLFENIEETIIHGDLFLGNIIYNHLDGNLIVLDPRGSFGEKGVFGDRLYDLAKLAHSFEGGYDFIVKDEFDFFKVDSNNFYYKLHKREIHEQISNYFLYDYLSIEDKNKIKFIQSLLFFSMLPFHKESKQRQFLMLARAIYFMDLFYTEKND